MMLAQRCQESNEDEDDDDYSEDEDPSLVFKYKERRIREIMKEHFPKINFDVSNISDKAWMISKRK